MNFIEAVYGFWFNLFYVFNFNSDFEVSDSVYGSMIILCSVLSVVAIVYFAFWLLIKLFGRFF